MKRVVLIGGGGFAKEVLDLARATDMHVVGYTAPEPGIIDLPYWGTFAHLAERRADFDGVTLAFGSVGLQMVRARAAMIAQIREAGYAAISIVSPHARVASGVVIGDGSVIAHDVILAVDAIVGEHCLLNNAAQLGHDATLGDNVTLAPLAFVAGSSRVGDDTLIGPGALVLQGLSVGTGVVVGVGANVMRSVPDHAIVKPENSKVIVQRAAKPDV